MMTSADIEAALRKALPTELHWQLADVAEILHAAASGAIRPELAQACLVTEPGFVALAQALAGRRLPASGALLSFGEASQLGDVSINDLAVRDLVADQLRTGRLMRITRRRRQLETCEQLLVSVLVGPAMLLLLLAPLLAG